MFDSILFRPHALDRQAIDFGQVAEAMVFYRQVHLFLSEASFDDLLRQISVDDLLELSDSGRIRVNVIRDIPATHEARKPDGVRYDFVTVELMRQDRSHRSPREIIQKSFYAATQKQGKSRRSAQRFLRNASVVSVNEGIPEETGVSGLSRADLKDASYVESAIKATVSVLAPSFRMPPNWHFQVSSLEGELRVDTNLDLAEINLRHKESFPFLDSQISVASLLDSIHSARVDLFLASKLSSELVTTPLSSAVIGQRLLGALGRVLPLAELGQLQLFQVEHLRGRSIREAVKSGERSVKELLALVERAERFREWLRDQPVDSRLIGEYSRAIVADTWAERLPAKVLRFILFTGAGMAFDNLLAAGVASLVELASAAGDSFLLDRMIKGWKPNQFVEEDLARFVSAQVDVSR